MAWFLPATPNSSTPFCSGLIRWHLCNQYILFTASLCYTWRKHFICHFVSFTILVAPPVTGVSRAVLAGVRVPPFRILFRQSHRRSRRFHHRKRPRWCSGLPRLCQTLSLGEKKKRNCTYCHGGNIHFKYTAIVYGLQCDTLCSKPWHLRVTRPVW